MDSKEIKNEQNSVKDGDETNVEVHPNISNEECGPLLAERDSSIEELRKEIDEMKKKLDESIEKQKLLGANEINLRKRHQKEKEILIQHIKENIFYGLIEIKTNIDRAFFQVQNAKNLQGVKKGISLVALQMEQYLKSEGLEEITGENIPFDPTLHEAIQTITDNNLQEEMVQKMVERGYQFQGRVIKPMCAVVAIPPEDK